MCWTGLNKRNLTTQCIYVRIRVNKSPTGLENEITKKFLGLTNDSKSLT